MSMKTAEKDSLIYVIDQNFQIVYSNDKLRQNIPEFEYGKYCYELLRGEQCQCAKCPLRPENKGQMILFSALHQEWVNASTAKIQWPGVDGDCYMIIFESIEDNSRSIFYSAVENADYDEMMRLNFQEDSYTILYNSNQKAGAETTKTGKISKMVRSIAEKFVHPDDRERFYEFWLLDRIGQPGVPLEMLNMYHGEFRKKMPDGNYLWAQQVFMPTRQSTENEVFVMSFYNVIGQENEWEEQIPGTLKEIWDEGIFDKQNFFKQAQKLMKRAKDGKEWCMVAIDVEGLKLFNEWYGRNSGDELLVGIANCLNRMQYENEGIVGYFGNDDFAVLTKNDKDKIEEMYSEIMTLLRFYNKRTGFLPSFGIYRIADSAESVFTAYDKAEIARTSIKGNYTIRIKEFDEEMLEKMESRYILFSDIQKALANNEFTFYLQPKCNMENGKIVGAEALVRWVSAERGIVSPGVFIPFLENSGLIAEVDTYIWEEVCKWQRSVIDRGIEPIPVSVNVSRIDIYTMDVPGYFAELIEKYDLDPDLIEIEITESIYSEDYNAIDGMVKALRQSGFCILMDDFGSGYSSLNMLKDIEIDVLKIDMRFLNIDEEKQSKGIGIIETIYNLAHLMGIGVVVEGVETEDQKEFLLKMGCGYGQGYYFYRPIPINDFEEIIEDGSNRETENFSGERDEIFYLKELFSHDMFSDILLNNIVGPVAFFDVSDGGTRIKITKCNENYYDLIDGFNFLPGHTENILEHIDKEHHPEIRSVIREARQNRYEGGRFDYCGHREDGTTIWIRIHLFFLREQDGHALFYGALSDVSDIYEKNRILAAQNEMLEFLNHDMPGGYYRHKHDEECTFTYVSQRFLDIFGYTRAELTEKFDDKFINMVHPDDRSQIYASLEALDENGGNFSQVYRMQSRDGYIQILDQSRKMTYNNWEFFQGLILRDINYSPVVNDRGREQSDPANEDLSSMMKWMPCGGFKYETDGEHRIVCMSESLLTMLGYTREGFERKFGNNAYRLVCEEDRSGVIESIKEQMKTGNYFSCEYRVELADGSLKWVYSRSRMVPDSNGKRWCYTCITDSGYLKRKYENQQWQMMKHQTAMPGAVLFDYAPETDRLTGDYFAKDGTLKPFKLNNFVEKLEDFSWIDRETIFEHKKTFLLALQRLMCSEAEFRMHLPGEQGFHWYRARYTSLAGKSGKIDSIVGRAEIIDREVQQIADWKTQAMTDSLTGLLNSKAAKEQVRILLNRQQDGAMILLDLDNFKQVNDTFGHVQGDEVIKNFANVIKSAFHKQDILARFGGDEFLIFMPELKETEVIAERMDKLMEMIRGIRPKDFAVRCSAGVAVSGDKKISADLLIRRADTAMYQSKRAGKDRYTFFTEQKKGQES